MFKKKESGDTATMTQEEHRGPARLSRRGPRWQRAWPAALGVLVAAATAYGLSDGRDVASIVAASGLAYLAAAATGRRWAAWVAFGITFSLVALDKFAGLDATRGSSPWPRPSWQWALWVDALARGGRCRCRPLRCSCSARPQCSPFA